MITGSNYSPDLKYAMFIQKDGLLRMCSEVGVSPFQTTLEKFGDF